MDISSDHKRDVHSEQWDSIAPKNLPNANLILILGILSIFLCWLHLVSFLGIVLGVAALYMSKKETSLFYSAPGRYTASSLNNVRAGRICAMIGLAISVVVFAFVMLMIIGILTTLPFWGMIH